MIRVIVIDDEAYVTSLFSEILNWEELGFEICKTFSSGNDALAWLEDNMCDVIFTDIAMPDMAGTEIARLCYERFPEILIVFFSAYRNFDYALDAIKYNVFDYILKPISYSSLLEAVNRLKAKISSSNSQEAQLHGEEDIIQSAKKYLNEHYCENISIVDVANHVCLSPGYFSTYFKQKTNENFVAVLKRMRLEKAKELLMDKNVKISHIPYQIGFKSYSYFTKVFQESYGVTPTDYRNNYLYSSGRGIKYEKNDLSSE